MYFVRYVIRSSFFFREPAHSHTDKFKNLGTLKSYQSMQYHAITLVLPFVWVPQFEIKKAKYCFYFNEATSTWNLRTIPTFSFHYPLSIRTGGVVCVQASVINSIGIKIEIILHRDSKYFEILRKNRELVFPVPAPPTPTRIRSYLYYFLFYYG